MLRMKTNELELVESEALRRIYVSRTEVLERVTGFELPDGRDWLTAEELAAGFTVTVDAVRKLTQRHRAELEEHGMRRAAKAEMEGIGQPVPYLSPEKMPWVYPRRAVLNVAMLLRDSEVARQLRTYLLDTEKKGRSGVPGKRPSISSRRVAELAAAGASGVELPDGTVLSGLNGKQAMTYLDYLDKKKSAAETAEAERRRLALMPREAIPWPKRDDEAIWEYDARLHGFFNSGKGDWDHVAELLAKHRGGSSNWLALYGEMQDRVREFARAYEPVAHPDWGLANAAVTYVDERYPVKKEKHEND
jgi:restriction system protein